MVKNVSRRLLLRGAAVGMTAGLAGCGQSGGPSPPNGEEATATYRGRVTDLDDNPVGDATIAALVSGTEPLTTTATNASGEFELSAGADPVWLRVEHPDFVTETRAVGASEKIHLPLTPDEGTVSIAFGGDVMFGRRFYEPSSDSLEPRARIHPGSRYADHRDVLQYVEPLFASADIGSVNLETPLTTSAWRHPSKEFTFTSHPVAARALADAGIDYTALGNNHSFDALTPGLRETMDAVDTADLARSGAGFSSDGAWRPGVVERGDMSVAMISCTTVIGQSFDIDWSADTTDGGQYTVTQDGESLRFSASAGSAEASPERLARTVRAAAADADVVVVQIHGDANYERAPTKRLVRLTDAAIDAGADMIVNHHPHVTGGLERRNGALVAWTLGNFVFDQELWETLRSYVLVAHVNDDGLQRAYTQPIVLSGYVPMATTETVARRTSWETAGLSTDAATLVSRGRRLELGQYAETVATPRQRIQQVSGEGDIYARTGGWVSDLTDRRGTVLLGRERLLTGGFDNESTNGDRAEGSLWRYQRTRSDGKQGGISLTAYPKDTNRSVLAPASRLPVSGRPLTALCRYRYPGDGGFSLLISWYNDTAGVSFESRTVQLDGTGDGWKLLRESLDPPANATHINLFAFLESPEEGEPRRVRVDSVRLVEWEPPATTGGREFDHLLVDGEAAVELQGVATTPSEWRRVTDE